MNYYASKETRDALREDLADSKIFLTQVPPPAEEKYCYYYQVSSLISITFTPEDILVKNPSHDWPLYYTGYIGSMKVERILIDPGSTLSIMPIQLMQFMHIPVQINPLLPLRSTVSMHRVADQSKKFY